jgi:hypothetical protein
MAREDGRLEVVPAESPHAPPRRQRIGIEHDRTARLGARMHLVPPRVRIRRGHAGAGYDQRRQGGQGREAVEPLAPPPRQRCRGAAREERDVGAQARGEVQQLVAWHGTTGESVRRMQRGGGVARPAAQPGAHGDPLGQREMNTEAAARRTEHGVGGAHRQVVGRGTEVGPVHRECHTGGRARDFDGIGEIEQREGGLDLVVAARLAGQHPQEQVDLGVRRDVHAVWRGHASVAGRARSSRRPMCARDSATRPSTVIGTKVVM